MSNVATQPEYWQEANNRYLEAAVAWLRLRLLFFAEQSASPAKATSKPAQLREEEQRNRWLGRKTPAVAPAEDISAPPPSAWSKAEETDALEAMKSLENGIHLPAFAVLANRFGLSEFERNLLLLCVAQEFDTRIPYLCSQVHGDPQQNHPTFDLAMALFGDAAWDSRSPERPLRYWRLIEVSSTGRTLGRSALRADDQIVDFVKGLSYLDDRLRPLMIPVDQPASNALSAESQHILAEKIARTLNSMRGVSRIPIVQLTGIDIVVQRQIAANAASILGLGLLRLPAEALPSQPFELENLARLWYRQSLLLPLALIVEAGDIDTAEPAFANLTRFLGWCDGAVFVAVRESMVRLDRQNVVFETARPRPEEQRAFWGKKVGEVPAAALDRLSAQYNFHLPTIDQAITIAAVGDQSEPLQSRLWFACRTLSRPRLHSLAQRIDSKATWDDIVLPPETLALLRHLADQVRHRWRVYNDWGYRARMNRGLGICALFTGESGAGKTMAAEVIANHLQIDAYRVDTSTVISKYIGETPKNLRRLFDAAEDGGVILVFDEADALFGKRSEVKDSHDRYANIEIDYLLQRIEGYRGLAILTTNLKQAIDTAFMRRFRFVVPIPFPGAAQRKKIWQLAFSHETPLENIDFDRLSRFNLSGGSIQAAALSAVFMAARQNCAVTMQTVLDAVRIEMRKLEQPTNESEFIAPRPEAVVV